MRLKAAFIYLKISACYYKLSGGNKKLYTPVVSILIVGIIVFVVGLCFAIYERKRRSFKTKP